MIVHVHAIAHAYSEIVLAPSGQKIALKKNFSKFYLIISNKIVRHELIEHEDTVIII